MTCKKKLSDQWVDGSNVHSGIPSKIFIPKDVSINEKLPMILFLHGAGERGGDNESQLVHIAPLLSSDSIQSKYPSILVFPQCPKDDFWAPVDRQGDKWLVGSEDRPRKAMASVIELLKKLMEDPRVDRDRIYLAGLSMGGFGTYDLLSRMPNTFAAAVPICGGADTEAMERYSHIPLWNFHGAQDAVVPVELSQEAISALIDVGGKPRYTEYPDGKHNVWTRAFDEPALLPWLFDQKRGKEKL